LNAMLQEWKPADDIIKQVEEIGGDASAKLFNLFQLAYEDGQLERQCELGQQVMPEPRSPGLTNVAWTIYRTYSFKLVSIDAKPRARLNSWVGGSPLGFLAVRLNG